MPGSTRTVRRVQTSKVADFDDQLWPINCAILILAGFATGIVIAKSDFDDPHLLYNGWARLFSVAVMIGLLFWGVMWLQGKMLRRLQFALLISLLAHLGLFTWWYDKYYQAKARWEAKRQDQVIEQYEKIIIPDYYWQQIERPHAQQSFERPMVNEAPRPTDPEAVQREAEEPDVPAKTAPPEEPEIPQRQQPNPSITRRTQPSAPRRADAAAGAQISRQPWKDRPSPNQPIPEPEITPQPRQTAALPDGTFAPRPQTQLRVRADRLRVSEEPLVGRAEQVEARLPQRAARREPVPSRRVDAAPARQSSPLVQIPPAEIAAPEPVEVARRAPTDAPSPADTAAARRQADAPRVIRSAAEPVSVMALRDLPVQPSPGELVREATRRAQRSTPPSSQRRTSRPARTARLEDGLLVATARIEPSAVRVLESSSERPAPPTAGPTTSVVSRGGDSLVRVLQDSPAARPFLPMSNTSQLPSAVAARRTAASQERPVGSDSVASRPSSLARFGGGAELPSTAIPVEATPAANPAASGGTPASRLQVVADAAVLRSAGQPRLGGGAAAPGSADFALGSTEVVARTGQPRSAGVGRSSPSATGPARRIARVAGPPAATAASGIAEATPTELGAVASGPSGLQIASLNVQDSATRRGGTVRPYAARAAVGSGPTGLSGTPGPVEVAQRTRATRHESVASAVAGGGTPRPGRTVGGDVAPSAIAEASEPATPAPGGGRATQAAPWRAQVSGPRRQVSGLPGQLQGQPMAGALAALADRGAPLSAAAARRAVTSQGGSGGVDSGSTRSSTLRRPNAGADLPAAAVAIEDVARPGAGGVTNLQGGLPSSLRTGPSASVRQAAARLPVGQSTAAAGTSESALGSADAVVLAGRARTVGGGGPGSGADAAARRIGRTAAAGPTIAAAATPGAEPSANPPTGGPAADAGNLGQATADALRAGVAQGSGRLPAFGTGQRPGMGSSPEGTAGGRGDDVAAAGRRRIVPGDGPGSALAGDWGRGPQRTTDASGLLSDITEPIGGPAIATPADAEPGYAVELAHAAVREPSRPEGGLPVRIAAVEGPGGLGYLPSAEVGIPSRRARPESEVIHTDFRRFISKPSGGHVAIDGRMRQEPTEAFRQRDPGRRAEVAQAWGGSEGTEAAVEMGLDYFARLQFPDGHWSLHELPEGIQYQDAALGEMQADSAATGLALLSYLGAGYTHLDDKYRGEVGRGIDWLIRHQKPDGELFTGGTKYARFYSHGIAAIALCEAYGMTRDPALRGPASKAVEFILNTQHPTRGGWRYDVRPDTGRATETDTSVSGWMLMALKSAQMAGLDVPQEALEKIDAWLDTAQAAGADGQYVYNPHAKDTPEQRAGRRPNLAMTSEAMLMRMYLGRDRDDPGLIAGAKHLKGNLPEVGTRARPLRDCYYWYYATQAMFQMQDAYWTAWNDRLRALLTSSQVESGELAGSWHPLRPVEDRWGRAAGRHYVTALHLLMLEVYYRHLPLFQELSR